jgi:hypothetical protein
MLPFVTPPRQAQVRRCGNAESGVLEIPVLGGLTVAETSMIELQVRDEESAFVEGCKAADAIAKEESGIQGRDFSISEAFQIIDNCIAGRTLEPEAQAVRLRHAKKLEAVARAYSLDGIHNMEATVTAIVSYRLKLPDWTIADTRTMHRRLFKDIWALAQDEIAAEQDMATTPPTEEELKKPLPEEGTGGRRRGRKSSGT